MKATFSSTDRGFTLRYVGLSFYYAWVFLSFNSLDIVGGDGRAISMVHIVSSATAMVMFAASALNWRSVMGLSLIHLSRRQAGLRRRVPRRRRRMVARLARAAVKAADRCGAGCARGQGARKHPA